MFSASESNRVKQNYKDENIHIRDFFTSIWHHISKINTSVKKSSNDYRRKIEQIEVADNSEGAILKKECAEQIQKTDELIQKLIQKLISNVNAHIESFNSNESIQLTEDDLNYFAILLYCEYYYRRYADRDEDQYLQMLKAIIPVLERNITDFLLDFNGNRAKIVGTDNQEIFWTTRKLITNLNSTKNEIRDEASRKIMNRKSILLLLFCSPLLLLIPAAFLLAIYAHPILGTSVCFLSFVSIGYYVKQNGDKFSHVSFQAEEESYISNQRDRYRGQCNLADDYPRIDSGETEEETIDDTLSDSALSL